MTDLSTLIVAVTVIFLAERWARPILSLHEKPKAVVDEPMPVAIVQLSQEYGTEWAQEEFMRRAHELYNEYRDWNAVYAALKGIN